MRRQLDHRHSPNPVFCQIAEGRGMLIPFNNPTAIAEKAVQLLSHEAERHSTPQ
jgi:hypothetical protein